MRTTSRRHRKLFAAAAAVALITFAAPPADAALTIDLRVFELNGQPLSGGNTPKDVLVAPGSTVTLDVYAQISGTNTDADELMNMAAGNVVTSGTLLGNLTGAPIAPFRGSGFQNGFQQDLDGDSDLDLGTPMNNQNVTHFFAPNASAPQPVTMTAGLPIGTAEVRIGRLTFAVSPTATGETFANFVTRVEENGSPASEGAVWFQDGGRDEFGQVQAKNAFNPTVSGAIYQAGAPVHIAVPEPAGLALAGLATLGLLARRRANDSLRRG